MDKFVKAAFLAAVVLVAPVGCSAPQATLDLISMGRKAIVSARQAQGDQHQEIVQKLESQKAALDAAFDADVRLAAAGQITNAEGEAVELSPEWVISARKGYATARDVLGEQVVSAETAHNQALDNLDAGDEALDMASQLIVQQWSVSERLKQQLLELQRRFISE